MSRDIKYIGVDVHQEVIVIAVAKAPTKENRPDSGAASCFVGIPRPGHAMFSPLTK